MDLRPADHYFEKQEGASGICLQFLRAYILGLHPDITEVWRYGMPFYLFRDQRFCYLWQHRKYRQPYIGIVQGQFIQHPALLQEQRAKMKILLVDPLTDIDTQLVNEILAAALQLCH